MSALLAVSTVNPVWATPNLDKKQYEQFVKKAKPYGDYQRGKQYLEKGEQDKAMEWFRKAARQGQTDAMMELSRLSKTEKERDYWFERAVRHGHPGALLQRSEELLFSDADAARELFIKALRRDLKREFGPRIFSRVYSMPENDRWIIWAAEKGHPDSQYHLGLQYVRLRDPVEAKTWFRRAAEQGQADAMMEMAHRSQDKKEQDRWRRKALAQRQSEALFEQAQSLSSSDPAGAKRLFLEAAERGSEPAIKLLIKDYATGGVLFARDPAAAARWMQRLTEVQAERRKYRVSALDWSEEDFKEIRGLGRRMAAGDPELLFQRGQYILRSPLADEPAKQRAIAYIKQAARKGHGEAAFYIARHYGLEGGDPERFNEALEWYELAVEAGSIRALEDLVFYYRDNDAHYPRDIKKAHAYSLRMFEMLDKQEGGNKQAARHRWRQFHADIERLMEQERERGGPMDELEQAAESGAHGKFLYGMAMEPTDHEQGMSYIREAASLGDQEARFYLAERTLRRQRTMDQEVKAIASLQKLAGEGYADACLMLGYLHMQVKGALPSNQYLARELFRRAQSASGFAERAQAALDELSPVTADLDLADAEAPMALIEGWYQRHRTSGTDKKMLEIQYRNLKSHFRPYKEFRASAEKGDAAAQYALSQALLNRDFEEAISWMKQAARNGSPDAQYEMAQRIFRSPINPPEQYRQAMRDLESAASRQHVGALVLLARQYAMGRKGCYNKDVEKAKRLYRKALDSTEGELVFSGEFRGVPIKVRRTSIEKKLATLN